MSERDWSAAMLPAPLPAPVGAYSPAVVAGPFIFISGQVPKDLRTGALVGEGVREQTRAVLENAARALEAAGSSLHDVVAVTAYLQSMDDWKAFDEEYRAAFTAPFPTRTTVGADLRGFLVELSFVAYRHDGQ